MKKIIPLALIIMGFLAGCSKDYLDRVPSDAVSNVSLAGNAEYNNALVLGIYKGMATFRTGHDDSGLTTYFLYNDIKGNDVVVPTNWYCYQAWFLRSQRAQTHRRSAYIWRWAYEMINNCNYVIANASEFNNVTWNGLQMEARVLRAYFYRTLLQHYCQHPRFAGLDAPGVPVSTTPATGDKAIDAKPRGVQRDVYTLIVEDLTWAITNGSAARTSKGRINTNVANGLLARVYLDLAYADEAAGAGTSAYWQKALDAAQAARSGFVLMEPADYKTGFNDYGNKEWIWGYRQDIEGNINYPSFYSFYDRNRNIGYKNFRISETFTPLFDANDQRACFSAGTPFYSITKFRDKTDNTGDLPLMRVAEMYLIEAECLVNKGAGDFAGAQAAINTVLAKRITGYAGEAALGTKNDMLHRVWVERRKELYGEGFAMPDINRLSHVPGIGAVRTDYFITNSSGAVKADTPTTDNSWGYFQQIPKAEFDNNPMMDITRDQNPLEYN